MRYVIVFFLSMNTTGGSVITAGSLALWKFNVNVTYYFRACVSTATLLTTISFNSVKLVFKFSNEFRRSSWLKRSRRLMSYFIMQIQLRQVVPPQFLLADHFAEVHYVVLIVSKIYDLEWYFGTGVYVFVLKYLKMHIKL